MPSTSAASAAKLHDLLGAKDFVTIANEKYENWGMKGQAVINPGTGHLAI